MTLANLNRRAILAGAISAPALALVGAPTGAIATDLDDPILAAIETHRCLYAAYIAAANISGDLEDSDPQYPAADKATAEAHEAADDAALKLFCVRPTSVGGAAALLAYHVEATKDDWQVFPEVQSPSASDNPTAAQATWNYAVLIMMNAAAALKGVPNSALFAPAAPALVAPAIDADAKLLALGDQLKAALVETNKLYPGDLYRTCWEAAGYNASPKGRALALAEQRFEEMAEKNGYHAAWKTWNAAASKQRRIAETILALKANSHAGDCIRAAAAMALNASELDEDVESVLSDIAERAGFDPRDFTAVG